MARTNTRWTCGTCGVALGRVKTHAWRLGHIHWWRVNDDGTKLYLSLANCLVADDNVRSGFRVVAPAKISLERPTAPLPPPRHVPVDDKIRRGAQFSVPTPYVESPDYDESGRPLKVTETDRHRAFLRQWMRHLRGELYRAGMCVECAGDEGHYPHCSRFPVSVANASVEIERELQDAV